MKIIKSVFFILILIIAAALITALFIEEDYAVEKEIVINMPRKQVFNYIKYLKNQDAFSVWSGMDPDMKKTYSGADGQPGFIYAWESEKDNVGKGEQEIKKIRENERIDYELRFIEPISSTASAYMQTESVFENQTKVKWGFTGRFTYPFNLMRLFTDMEETIGYDLARGLANLKRILESGEQSDIIEE